MSMGQKYHQNMVHTLVKRLTYEDLSGTYSLGWVPAGSGVVAAGAFKKVAWNGTGDEILDIGFRNSAEGMTTDPNAFTETAIDLDVGVGHVEGDVVSAANLWFNDEAEITCTIVNTDATAGSLYAYVTYVVDQNYQA